MEQLQKILAYKFWIVSGIAGILPIVGWWMATAGYSNEIKTRTDAINTAFSGASATGPNDKWIKPLQQLNSQEEQLVGLTGNGLWENQKSLMTWPESQQEQLQNLPFRAEIDPTIRTRYRITYPEERDKLYQIVSPVDLDTGEGLVDMSEELIPDEGWARSQIPPNSYEMWTSQEDIWLVRELLEAVARVNSNAEATNQLDSKIKQIVRLELRGGSPKTAGAQPAAGGAPPGVQGGAPPGMHAAGGVNPMMAAMMANAGKNGPPGVMGGAGGANTGASFDPTEEFGPETGTDASAPKAAGAPGAPAVGGAPPGPPGPPAGHGAAGPPGMMPGMNAMGAPGAGGPRKRYIEETKRYRTRGFYMEVVIDHRALPELVGELVSSKWPLKIVRVQQADNDTSDVSESSVGSAMANMGSAGVAARPTGGLGGGHAAGGAPPSAAPRTPMGSAAMPRTPMGLARPGNAASEGELAFDPSAAMNDPYLVQVAICGVFTLYLPPEAATGQPGAPGAPAAPGTPPATGAAPATSGTTGTPAPMGTAPATPMNTTAPAAPGTSAAAPGTPATPAAPKAAAPGTPPATTAPMPETPPATPAGNGTLPAGGNAPNPAAPANPAPVPAAPASGTPAPATPPAGTPAAPAASGQPSTTPPAAPAEKKG